MRTLTDVLLAEQKKHVPAKPLVKLEVQAYGHPAATPAGGVQWEAFQWQRFYSGSETKDSHGVTMPGDGSLIRVRKSGTNLYLSRVTSPGPSSTYSSWGASFGGVPALSKVGIGSLAANVIVATMDASMLYRKESTDYGATWGSWTSMPNARPCERGVAVAFKPNGDCAIVHASDINDPMSLYIQKRTSGTWSTGLGQRGSYDAEIIDLAMYYDGDWNIMALVQEGSYISVVRMVYGDGYRQAAGTWATDVKVGLGRARVDVAAQVRARQFEVGWPVGFRRMQPWGPWEPRNASTYWERHQAVYDALAGETLDVSGASLVKPPTSCSRPLFCTSRQNQPWIFRLKPGTDFFDYNWNKASFIDTSASVGMALAADATGEYIWATQPDEVWRSPCVGSWSPPTPGSGAGDKITIPVSKIARIEEAVDPEQQSELQVELENSKGTYNSPGSGDLAVVKRGARVNLHLGYKTTSGDQLSEASRYFIEAMEYKRDPNIQSFILHCIDAWGLLQRYQFNKPVEWNASSDDFTCYQLIEKVMQSVGGALDYKSRSSLITSLYPKIEVGAGESGASVLRRLLNLVPDVIFFFGLDAYIVHPQASDEAVYSYQFPAPTARLIGASIAGTGNPASGYFRLGKFTALSTGKVAQMKVYTLVNGEIKVAIYADAAGEPGALITANNTGQAVAAARWNDLIIGDTSITKGTVYWLAANFNATGAMAMRSGVGGVDRYKVATYSTFTFPDPAGAGFTNGTREYCLAGWGNLHVVLDGNYIVETPEKNRMFIIGRDIYGNPVYGEAHDTTESALVGERLDFQQDLAIPTTAQAADIAAAILAKMRLTTKRGVILIPPNCGQELWDAVELSDTGANQSAVKFRVIGIRFQYHPRQAKYEHRLILGAP